MRYSKTLRKIRDGQAVRICSMGDPMPFYIAQAARAGFDCIWLDMEHRVWDHRELQSLMPLFHQFDIDCMLRPPTRERAQLYRFLEDGASGLLMPHVSTPALAREIASAVKFPPLGDRGLDGVGYDAYYDLGSMDEFVEHQNKETFLVLQIETPEAVENVEEIAKTPGLTGLFVGPGDLGLRYRIEGRPEALEEAIERTAAAAKAAGIAWGMPAGTQEALELRRKQGAQILAVGGPYFWLLEALNGAVKMFDAIE